MNYHDRYSIFGDTYRGVPNPMVPHKHPYPTRFHGPVFKYPMPGWSYNVSPYARAPFDGFGLGATGDCPANPEPTSKGQQGPAVTCWQKFLIAQGFDLGSRGADGDHGDRTETATQAWRAKQGKVAPATPQPPSPDESKSATFIEGVPNEALYVAGAGLVLLGVAIVLKSRRPSSPARASG